MVGMIKSSIHHFDGFDGGGGVGLAEDGGGSDKDGGGAAICGVLFVGAVIDTVGTTFSVASTLVDRWGGTGGAGCPLSPGSGWVTTGVDCFAQRNKSLERPGLP